MKPEIFKRINYAIGNTRSLKPRELRWIVNDVTEMHEQWDDKPAPESVGDYFSNVELLFTRINQTRPDLRCHIPPQYAIRRGIEELDRLDYLREHIGTITTEDVKEVLTKRGSIDEKAKVCTSLPPGVGQYAIESDHFFKQVLRQRPDLAQNADLYIALRRA